MISVADGSFDTDERGLTEREFGAELVALIENTARAVYVAGGRPEVCILTPVEHLAIVKAMESKAKLLGLPPFPADRQTLDCVWTSAGPVYLVPRRDCPAGRLIVGARADLLPDVAP